MHVANLRNILQHGRTRGEQRRHHGLAHEVLRATHLDGAVQRLATFDVQNVVVVVRHAQPLSLPLYGSSLKHTNPQFAIRHVVAREMPRSAQCLPISFDFRPKYPATGTIHPPNRIPAGKNFQSVEESSRYKPLHRPKTSSHWKNHPPTASQRAKPSSHWKNQDGQLPPCCTNPSSEWEKGR